MRGQAADSAATRGIDHFAFGAGRLPGPGLPKEFGLADVSQACGTSTGLVTAPTTTSSTVAPPTTTNNYNGCVQESGLTNVSITGNNQISGFCYDSAGNLLRHASSCSSPTYAYNAESELTSTAGVTYTYDGDG